MASIETTCSRTWTMKPVSYSGGNINGLLYFYLLFFLIVADYITRMQLIRWYNFKHWDMLLTHHLELCLQWLYKPIVHSSTFLSTHLFTVLPRMAVFLPPNHLLSVLFLPKLFLVQQTFQPITVFHQHSSEPLQYFSSVVWGFCGRGKHKQDHRWSGVFPWVM